MGPKNTRSRAGGPKGNELKLINLELVIMGFYTILNIGQLTGDNLISPGAPVNNCLLGFSSVVLGSASPGYKNVAMVLTH